MKTNDCPFCDFGSVYEYKSTEHFQYGCDDDAVMLWTNVIVLACTRCSQQWTDYRSEDSRQAAVEKHLATKGIYLCGVCHSVPVDTANGIDTCDKCEKGA